MKLSVTGLNHTTAPVEVRERLAFDPLSLPQVTGELRTLPGLREGVILSTCNRVEIAVTADDAVNAREAVEEFLARVRSVERNWLSPYLYHFDGREAIRHLFRVAASLDSMVVGEPQILGQLKAAFETAKSQGAVAGVLETVMTRAFNVAKRVRSETEIGHSAVSVSYTAVELARQIFGSLKDSSVMLLGAGKMSVLAARHLERAGAKEIVVTNRSSERARQMAEMFHARVVDYHNLHSALPGIDVLIASSGAPHYILKKDDIRQVIAARRNRPMFLIDIAVPRNIDPAVNELEGVFLYDIDDLRKVIDQNRQGRMQQAEEAERIIDGEVERLLTRLQERQASPTIVSLQQQLENIRASEIERLRSRLGNLTPQQEEAVEAITRGIVNKIAHAPITELRRQTTGTGGPNGAQIVEVIRRLFRLDS
ncbi:MAG: glutamyl-tRNA reductase [Acidobacteriia bacterium]|nr:glutamyl-tRNA reductase [Terriglobia bacterium]